MIFLLNTETNTMCGQFGSNQLINEYFISKGIVDTSKYIYLQKVETMSYISRICYVDDVIIYNNKEFWTINALNIYNDFSNHTVLDWKGNSITALNLYKEYSENCSRIQNIEDIADAVAYNIRIGNEFISLFREECVNGDLGPLNGLDIATKTSNVIPLVMTGSFKEAAYVLANITPDVFLTTELLTKYKNMLLSADVITYQR
jgi:hypothetical protein